MTYFINCVYGECLGNRILEAFSKHVFSFPDIEFEYDGIFLKGQILEHVCDEVLK
jgi:hypothetical protein